jgi:ABC-type uncharacterized transport system involved in gliding motility auxiliary subunit
MNNMMNRFPYLKPILKYSFIPGLILAVAGLVAGFLTKTWSPLYVGLLVAGSVFLLVWLIYTFISAQGFWQRRSTQAGTNALIATLSLLAILGLINFLAIRYPVRIDLTENQLFTLSSQSQEIVDKLQQPIKVIIFDKQPNSTDKELLNNYRRYSSNFEYEFIDPDVKPGIAKEFNVKSLGDVYLQSGDKKQLVQTVSVREPLSEIKLTNAIEKIQRQRVQTIYFLQGHGERSLESGKDGMSEAESSLKEKGYRIEPLNLAQSSGIPEAADVIIIAGAKRQLFPQEVEALKTYADTGGNLFLMIDPETDTGLEPLLKDWGVNLDNRIIIDASGTGRSVGLGPTTPIIVQYGEHPIVKDFSNGFSFYPLARRVEAVKATNVQAFPILIASEQMWAESNLNSPEVKFDENQDIAGPFDLGVALTRKITEKPKEAEKAATSPTNSQASPSPTPTVEASPSPQKTSEASVSPSPSLPSSDSEKKPQPKTESRLVVLGNSTFATNSWFKQQLNGDVFLNSVQWLASSDKEPLSIRPKEAKNRRINLTPLQAGLLGWLSLLIVPLFGLVLAGITWWRRR